MIRRIWSAIMKWGWDYNRGNDCDVKVTRKFDGVNVEGLTFNVMAAQGGTIVQVRYYDRKTDRSGSVTHVIPEGDDISTAIGHIVSMELLRA